MNIVPFHFEELALMETCWITGKPYFTRRAIGEWLGAEQPHQYIRKIIERNPHISQFATVVNLGTVEGNREVFRDVEVYDPIGLQLIVFESNLPKAIQFKVAVAHLVYAYMKGELKPSKWTLKDDLLSASQQILSLPQGTKRAALVKDLAERDGVCFQTAYRRVGLVTGQRLKTKDGHVIKRKDAGTTKYPAEKAKVLAFKKANPEAQGAQIKQALGLHLHRNHICRWLREFEAGR